MKISMNETSKGHERGEIDLPNKLGTENLNMNNVKIFICVKCCLLLFAFILAIRCLSVKSDGMIPDNSEINLPKQTSSLMPKQGHQHGEKQFHQPKINSLTQFNTQKKKRHLSVWTKNCCPTSQRCGILSEDCCKIDVRGCYMWVFCYDKADDLNCQRVRHIAMKVDGYWAI